MTRADEIITRHEIAELRDAGYLIVQKPETKISTLPMKGTSVVVKGDVGDQSVEGMHIVSEQQAMLAETNPIAMGGQIATMQYLQGLAAALGLLEKATDTRD
jgi:hypothetical protein